MPQVRGLWYTADNPSKCTVDGEHSKAGSHTYILMDGVGPPDQSNWRICGQCMSYSMVTKLRNSQMNVSPRVDNITSTLSILLGNMAC